MAPMAWGVVMEASSAAGNCSARSSEPSGSFFAAVNEQLAKAKPDTLNYASTGAGSSNHLTTELFKATSGASFNHVPYKGGAPAINDALAGTVDMLFAVLPEALPHIQSGKLHALGLMAAQRTGTLPQTPTMAEAGAPEMNLSAWVGLLAPAKTPQTVIDRLQRAAAS